ncbi:MAG: MOSC domain-containing protein [Planctomycetales bacterium]|nr:MOSC domain-containing protein [Planctomycetales bacterium]NIP67783.1 MOSC domain-containing protein [Planctomycetales bacterium]
MQLISLNVAQPQLVLRDGRRYSTAINKQPVIGPLDLDTNGLAGDRPADGAHHGGPDKAVCCYPHEHYPYFAARLGTDRLALPSFGENFTTSGLLENEVCIGDTFAVGQAVVQVTQPRDPCWKLAQKHHRRELVQWVLQSQFTGFYLRVLQPGQITAGDKLRLLQRPHPQATVASATIAMHAKPAAPQQIAKFRQLPELSAAWRGQFTERLAQIPFDG